MPKPMDPMKVMNLMGKAAHDKSQPEKEPDEDDMPMKAKKSSKQAAAIGEKKKGNAKAPKFSKPA